MDSRGYTGVALGDVGVILYIWVMSGLYTDYDRENGNYRDCSRMMGLLHARAALYGDL